MKINNHTSLVGFTNACLTNLGVVMPEVYYSPSSGKWIVEGHGIFDHECDAHTEARKHAV